jgi:Transposase DDE domain
MVDPDTFLTTLYVMVDEFCQSHLLPEVHPGPPASLSRSEVVTLGLFEQWACFPGERAFYRYAQRYLRAAFPTLPHRTQFNRLLRRHYEAIVACFLHLVDLLDGRRGLYEALDTSAVPTRDAKRRGAGWLPGLADIGWSNRLGWYEGFHLLMAVNPRGIITGFGVGPASAKDQPLAETFFALRRQAHPRYLSVGKPALGPYLSDKGFEGQAAHRRWWHYYGAQVICPPKRNSHQSWSQRRRRWLAGARQIVETVYDKVHHAFGLSHERPHAWSGFQARLAAKMALHNFCIWLNEQLGRPSLAFADLVDW